MKTGNEIIELKGFDSVKGKHCESTSIMNALNHQGLNLSEDMINGLGSSMSFMFRKTGGFPFIGGRVTDMKENLCRTTGLKFVECQPENPQVAYDWAKNVLKKGIPVILRVDMRYLPYRYGGKYGPKKSSFGWHFVTLIGIDEKSSIAYVTETDEQGIDSIEKINIYDLAKARNSKEGELKADNYCYYFDDPKNIDIDYKKALKKSLQTLVKNMRGGGLDMMKSFGDDMIDIEKYVGSKYVLKPLFYTFYGYIEIFGSGGASFRNFYRNYLAETGRILSDEKITGLSKYVDNSCIVWHELSNEFKTISEKLNYNNIEERKEMYKKASGIIKNLYAVEYKMIEQFEEFESSL